MCELLAMSAKLPTDISFSFAGFASRGGNTGPHKDGFGICFYEGKAVREFKDFKPSCASPITQFLQTYQIKSTAVIAHIRQANVGRISLENTHPFQRELGGRVWTFAHNGQMDINVIPAPDYYTPVGETDSEKVFCWLLGELRKHYQSGDRMNNHSPLLEEMCNHLNQFGVSNILMSDGHSLFVFCSTKLHWITRRAPFGTAHLTDADWAIDFSAVTTEEDIVTVIATQPLTDNELWSPMKPGESRIFEQGESIRQCFGPEIVHKKEADS
ncbi:MAG: class II glutamine amidotransferase [Reinekea sp.]